MENNLLARNGIPREEETARWQKHRLEQLQVWAAFSFEQKVQRLEDMEETTLIIGNYLDPTTDRLCRRGN